MAAHDAAVSYDKKTLGDGGYDSETVHTMDYVEYAYLQTAQDGKAKPVRAMNCSPIQRARGPISQPPARWRRSRRDMRSSATTVKWRLRSRRRRSASRSTNSRGPRR